MCQKSLEESCARSSIAQTACPWGEAATAPLPWSDTNCITGGLVFVTPSIGIG